MPTPNPDLFGRDQSDDLFNESLDAFFYFCARCVRELVLNPHAFLLSFETLKIEFRTHIKEILKHAAS